MTTFAEMLLSVATSAGEVHAWVVLPNHYHVLLDAPDIPALLRTIGLLHGRSSHAWNGEDSTRRRKVWHGAAETAIRSERHFWAAMNYVHNNPVRHGYVKRWQDWPYSSAADYLAEVGRDEAARCWRALPVDRFGDGWDSPDL